MVDIKSLIRGMGEVLQKNSPYILTGLGAAGVVTTAVLTGRAAIKASDLIYEKSDLLTMKLSQEELAKRGNPHAYEMTWQEKINLTWKCYIPPVLMGVSSIACIIGAQSVNTKRNAALAAAYSLTESTLLDYQEKVKEHLGEKKEQHIRDEVAQKRLDDNPASKSEIIVTDKGDTLCYDSISGRYFKSDIEKLRRIQNDLNHDLMGVMWVPLNDLYFAMGLSGIKIGEDLGWTVDELIDFRFSSKITDEGEPCLVIDYDLTPRFLKKNIWGGM
ncbi:DUF6353 family protein [Turicimonas muris]|uniref:DUF6353 family protein n=1 Tax=Turicimonas muris TaxID=1796652 RepID=UPI0026033A59|nr:DUF6353 family protein [Turicimonas muris]